MYPLKSLTLESDYRNLRVGLNIEFKPVTLLVGDQGSGKSTILKLIKESTSTLKDYVTLDIAKCSYKAFDTEKDNPRMAKALYDDNRLYGQLATTFASHGEAIKAIMRSLRSFSEELIFIDEPESGLSVRSCYEFSAMIKSLSAEKQFIICTHSPIIMQEIGVVYSMEHLSWLSATEFIETQKLV